MRYAKPRGMGRRSAPLFIGGAMADQTLVPTKKYTWWMEYLVDSAKVAFWCALGAVLVAFLTPFPPERFSSIGKAPELFSSRWFELRMSQAVVHGSLGLLFGMISAAVCGAITALIVVGQYVRCSGVNRLRDTRQESVVRAARKTWDFMRHLELWIPMFIVGYMIIRTALWRFYT